MPIPYVTPAGRFRNNARLQGMPSFKDQEMAELLDKCTFAPAILAHKFDRKSICARKAQRRALIVSAAKKECTFAPKLNSLASGPSQEPVYERLHRSAIAKEIETRPISYSSDFPLSRRVAYMYETGIAKMRQLNNEAGRNRKQKITVQVTQRTEEIVKHKLRTEIERVCDQDKQEFTRTDFYILLKQLLFISVQGDTACAAKLWRQVAAGENTVSAETAKDAIVALCEQPEKFAELFSNRLANKPLVRRLSGEEKGHPSISPNSKRIVEDLRLNFTQSEISSKFLVELLNLKREDMRAKST